MKRLNNFKGEGKWETQTGLAFGLAAWGLTNDWLGKGMVNPRNMGICSACFIRDTAGALRLHGKASLSYIRPEIIGFVLGAFVLSGLTGKFKPRGGVAPFSRFLLGVVMMLGALIFLGCPLRMVQRLAGGDLNALVGLGGLVTGIIVGTLFKNRGTSLGRSQDQSLLEGLLLPVFLSLLLVVFLKGGLSGRTVRHAPWWLSLGFAFVLGALAFKSQFCVIGAFRNLIFYRNARMLKGVLVFFFTLLLGNILSGNFNLGFENQPIAHSENLWNFLGLFILGWAACIASGCPLRQLIHAASGDGDAAVTVLGLFTGAGIAHNWGTATSPAGLGASTVTGGIVSLLILLTLSILQRSRE